MDLEILVDRTIAQLERMPYLESTRKIHRWGRFSSIRSFFAGRGQAEFSLELAEEYMAYIREKRRRKELTESYSASLVKRALWLIEMYQAGTITRKTVFPSKYHLEPQFESILCKYVDTIRPHYSSANVAGQSSCVRIFLHYIQKEKTHLTLSAVTHSDVHDFITYKTILHPGSISNYTHALGKFFPYLLENSLLECDLTAALLKPSPRPERVLPGFTHEEVALLLAQPDRETAIGKRDYALLHLAKSSGLRAWDIVAIRFSDINWGKDEIHIVQEKTKTPLILPLDQETKTAIIDYIRHGRPKSESPHIFLKHVNPHVRFSGSQAVGDLFRKYLEMAGIEHSALDGKSFRGLRRSLATWMLETEISLTTISQILGHRNMNSANPYLSIDEKGLAICALTLAGIEVSKEGLR